MFTEPRSICPTSLCFVHPSIRVTEITHRHCKSHLVLLYYACLLAVFLLSPHARMLLRRILIFQSQCYTIDRVDESYEFLRLQDSMRSIGFCGEVQQKYVLKPSVRVLKCFRPTLTFLVNLVHYHVAFFQPRNECKFFGPREALCLSSSVLVLPLYVTAPRDS